MITIPIQPVPNQSLSIRLDGQVYDIQIDTRRERQYATVAIDRVVVARNRALLPFAPIEGNLILADTLGTSASFADWRQLGTRFILMHWTPENG